MPKVYQEIASRIVAMRNCNKHGNGEWFTRHHDAIDNIVREYLPSGSGFDAGTKFDACENVDAGTDKLTFIISFHHMDEHGGYDGWTEHKVIIKPDLARGFSMTVTGRDRNAIKDYIADVFHAALDQDYSI